MGTCLIKILALLPILIIFWIFSSPALAAPQYFDQNGGGYSVPPSGAYFTWDPTTGSSTCPFSNAITSPNLTPCGGSVGGFSNTCCESSGGCTAGDGSRINLWDFNYVSGCTATPWVYGACDFSYTYQTQTCGATDTCQSSPYLYAGACNPACTGQTSCTGANACIVRGLYKTCCNSDGTVDGACRGGQFTGTCPAGTTTVLCGVDSGTCAAVAPYPCTTAACGQAACQSIAPAIPDCNSEISCSGTCTPTSSNTCSNNGIQNGCNYTTYSGGGICTQVTAPNQTCSVDNCSAGNTCVGGICTTGGGGGGGGGQVCDPYSQGPICDTAYCSSDYSVCGQGHQYCLWDGSGYGACSEEVNNCASQCTTPTPSPSPSGQCNYGACGAAGGCTAGSRYVSGSNCPSWYTNPGCYQDATCPSSGGGCVGPNCNVLSDYACWEYVSKDATNWSTNSVSAIGGDTVYFKMDVKALKDSLSFYVRNKFDDLVDGYTNIYQNTNGWNNWVSGYGATPLRGMGDPNCWGWPGFCPDWHNYNANGDIENWGNGTGMTGNRASAWSVVVNSDAQTFKNKPFVATDGSISPGRNLRFGSCVPQSDPNLPGYNNGTCCWQDPASGGPTCITMKTYCDGVPCNCNPAWGECQFGMTFQCNTVTVNTTLPISGYVKDSQTKAGLPNVEIQVYDNDLPLPLPQKTKTTRTAPNGHWVVNDFVRAGDFYAVRVTGNSNPQKAPPGYAPPAKTSTLGWTWNTYTGADTPLSSLSYESQQAGSNDCAGPNGAGVDDRCSFEYDSGSPKGYLDNAYCTSFTGWACDGDNYNQPIDVHFYANGPAGSGSYLGKTSANKPREAAVASACGGNPNHGFTFTTPESLKDGANHSIYAYGINIPAGNNPQLSNVPKTINCPAAAAKYSCNGTSCVPNVNGTYTSLTACNAACGGGGGANTPWIQTTGGDVHSNTRINTPGGP